MTIEKLVLKPFRREHFVYHSTLSENDFMYRLQLATLAKPMLVIDTVFSGEVYGRSTFKLIHKFDAYKLTINGYPAEIVGEFSLSEQNNVVVTFLLHQEQFMGPWQ